MTSEVWHVYMICELVGLAESSVLKMVLSCLAEFNFHVERAKMHEWRPCQDLGGFQRHVIGCQCVRAFRCKEAVQQYRTRYPDDMDYSLTVVFDRKCQRFLSTNISKICTCTSLKAKTPLPLVHHVHVQSQKVVTNKSSNHHGC